MQPAVFPQAASAPLAGPARDASHPAEEGGEARRLALPPRLDPAAAEELAEALEHLRGLPLILDGSAVQQPGGLFLQLLAMARCQWRSDAQPFRLTDPSPALADALELLDLARLFQPEEAVECR